MYLPIQLIWIFLSFASLGQSLCNVADCFTVVRFSYPTGVTSNDSAGNYELTVSWKTTLLNIKKAAYSIRGLVSTQSAYMLMSFNAFFSSYNSTYGIMSLTLPPTHNGYGIIYFIGIAVNQCSQNFYLQYVDYYPSVLNSTSRSTEHQIVQVSAGLVFGSNLDRYASQVMISCYTLQNIVSRLSLRVKTLPMVSGLDYQQIDLFSSLANQMNIFTRIGFTYVLLEVSSYDETLSYVNVPLTISSFPPPNYHNFNIPSNFNPYISRKCMIGVKWLSTYSINNAKTQITYFDTGDTNNTNYSDIITLNLDIVELSSFCFQICPKCLQNQYLYQPLQQCLSLCPSGYYANIATSKCVSCQDSSFYQLVNQTCVCADGYHEVASTCTNIVGCTLPFIEFDQQICYFCNISLGFYLNNNSCLCKTGFSLQTDHCEQMCGDGMLFSQQCDDGNLIDGDGCSDQCQFQDNYRCQNGTSSSPSQCIYVKKDIKLSLQKIDKTKMANQGVFTFQLTPFLYNFNKLNLTNNLTFLCNQSILINKAVINNGQLAIYVQFFQDLQGNQASVNLTLQSSYFVQSFVSLNFQMKSNGVKLIMIKNEQRIVLCKDIIESLSITIFVVFFISLLTHKMMGVQLIHTFQLMYLVHLINRNYTNPYSLISLFSISTFDILSQFNLSTSIYSEKQNISFSLENQMTNMLLMFLLSYVVLAICGFVRIINELNKKKTISDEQTSNPQLLKNILRTVCNNVLFSFSLGILIISFLITVTQNSNNSPKNIKFMCILQIILLSLIYFNQLKAIFVERCFCKDWLGIERCKAYYLPLYLLNSLVVTIMLSYAYKQPSFSVQLYLLVNQSLFFILILVTIPYTDINHNIGLVINMVTLLSFLLWSWMKSANLIDQSEDTQILILFAQSVLILTSLIATIYRIVFQFRRKNKNTCKRAEQNRAKKTKEPRTAQMESLFKYQAAFMNKISKVNLQNYSKFQQAGFNFCKRNNKAVEGRKKKSKFNEILLAYKQNEGDRSLI